MTVFSTFDTDLEGWGFAGDAASLRHVDTGGNPGGYIEAVDAGTGGSGSGAYWYFVAPSAFLGDKSGYLGGSLSFDLKQSTTASQLDNDDVVMTGGGLTLALDLTHPATSWTSYSVTLGTGADWRIGDEDGAVATEAQIQAVLGDLDSLHIRGEYVGGPDTGGLDNVQLTASTPPGFTLGEPLAGGTSRASFLKYMGITTGDLNNDGFADIVYTHAGWDVHVFLNNGDGAFADGNVMSESWWLTGQEHSQDAIGPIWTTLGDLDGDDTLDMAIAIYGPHYSGRMVQLYRGLGDGTFEVWAADGYDAVNDTQGLDRDGVDDGVILSQGTNPMSTLIGDFDGDGTNDVVVSTNNGGWKLDVLIQDATGDLTLVDSDRAGQNPHFLAQADFNEDGFMDVVAGSWLSKIHVFLNDADGTGGMTESASYLGYRGGNQNIIAVDVDGDGHQDIISRNQDAPHVTVLYGDGTGSFPTQVEYATSGSGGHLGAADMDGDGDIDLVLASVTTSSVDLLLNKGGRGFAAPYSIVLDNAPRGIALDDLDNDGLIDIVASLDNATVQVLWNTGNAIDVPGDGTVHGTEGNDVIDASFTDADGDSIDSGLSTGIGGNSDVVLAGEGDDRVEAGMGDDTVFGEAGADTLIGGSGADSLRGGDGDDWIDGGSGLDLIFGDEGADRLIGNTGHDTLYGGDDNDTLTGGMHDDELHGGAGNDSLDGGKDDDTLFGGSGDDTLFGGTGADLLHGDSGNDLIDGGTDRDTIYGGSGNDTIDGGSNADEIYGGTGDDVIDGGSGSDYISGDIWHTDGADHLIGGSGHDTLYGVGGDDTLSGGLHDDELHGGAGDDVINGDGNDDTLFGGSGDDTLDGGTGADLIHGDSGSDMILGGTAEDTIFGGSGDDTIDGGSNADLIAGQSGDDSILGGSGHDTISGGAGDDTVMGGTGFDMLDGGSGHDVLYGGDHADTLKGTLGNDWLDGGSGDDLLYGGSDDDTLIGGEGQDMLYGGWGADVFVFATASDSPHGPGRDVIRDFTPGEDLIDLSGFGGLIFVASYSGAGNEVRYDDSIGRLYVDLDGGASDFSVDLSGAPALDAGDLIL